MPKFTDTRYRNSPAEPVVDIGRAAVSDLRLDDLVGHVEHPIAGIRIARDGAAVDVIFAVVQHYATAQFRNRPDSDALAASMVSATRDLLAGPGITTLHRR